MFIYLRCKTEQTYTMSKNTIKIGRKYNFVAVNSLAQKYGFSARYIRDILSDNRTPIFSDRIKAEYQTLDNQIKQTIDNNKTI